VDGRGRRFAAGFRGRSRPAVTGCGASRRSVQEAAVAEGVQPESGPPLLPTHELARNELESFLDGLLERLNSVRSLTVMVRQVLAT
jgi:hypothetical protein